VIFFHACARVGSRADLPHHDTLQYYTNTTSTPTTAHQLFLLADHLKLSLLERQRALSLNLDSTKQDGHIHRSLSQFHDGIQQLEQRQRELGNQSADLPRLRKQYADLYAQSHGYEVVATQSTPSRNKSVRFRDDPDDEDAEAHANRTALFSDPERCRDEPQGDDQSEGADQSALDNQKIHIYHKQVLREQDDQLDVLGQTIGRQRILGSQMGNELDERVELLDDVERGVDRHIQTLGGAQQRLKTISRKAKDNWNWLTIAILIIILLLLLIILN
jgi:syntaxin 8